MACGPVASAGVGLGLALGDLDARAALTWYIQSSKSAGELALASDDDVIAVGRPGRGGELDLLVLAERLRIGAVGLGDPDVLCAAAVADEGDQFAVGREARLAVEGQAGGDLLGLAARRSARCRGRRAARR